MTIATEQRIKALIFFSRLKDPKPQWIENWTPDYVAPVAPVPRAVPE